MANSLRFPRSGTNGFVSTAGATLRDGGDQHVRLAREGRCQLGAAEIPDALGCAGAFRASEAAEFQVTGTQGAVPPSWETGSVCSDRGRAPQVTTRFMVFYRAGANRLSPIGEHQSDGLATVLIRQHGSGV